MITSFSLRTLSRDDILHPSGIKRYPASCVNGGASVSFMLPLVRKRRRPSGNMSPTAWRPGSASCWPP